MNTNNRERASSAIATIVTLILVLLLTVFNGCRIINDLEEELNARDEQLRVAESKIKHASDTQYKLKTELRELENSLNAYTGSVKYDVAAAPLYDIALSEELQQYTYETCLHYGIPSSYETVLAIMWQESDFNRFVVSSTGDYGIMQINECNHEYLQDTLGIVDIMDPYDNIESGIYIFASLKHTYKDDSKALMAYNMGRSGAEKQWDRGNYTSAYSRSVLSKVDLIKDSKK